MTTPADNRLAQLRTAHGTHWDIWKVTTKIGTAWCVTQPGEHAAIHQEATADQLEAWLNRVDALRAMGADIHFRQPRNPSHPVTATITYDHPDTRTPATYGPAPVNDAIDHAEATLTATPANDAARLRNALTRRYPQASTTTTPGSDGPLALTQASDGTLTAISAPPGPSTILAILNRQATSEDDAPTASEHDEGDEGDEGDG